MSLLTHWLDSCNGKNFIEVKRDHGHYASSGQDARPRAADMVTTCVPQVTT